jgi:hypothetical protein
MDTDDSLVKTRSISKKNLRTIGAWHSKTLRYRVKTSIVVRYGIGTKLFNTGFVKQITGWTSTV